MTGRKQFFVPSRDQFEFYRAQFKGWIFALNLCTGYFVCSEWAQSHLIGFLPIQRQNTCDKWRCGHQSKLGAEPPQSASAPSRAPVSGLFAISKVVVPIFGVLVINVCITFNLPLKFRPPARTKLSCHIAPCCLLHL